MTLGTFIGATTNHYLVGPAAGQPIPVVMPTGIQAGDELVVFMENFHSNPVSISGPSGWTGGLSTGFFTKTADGSEDGATLNWTTQVTTVAAASQHVLVIAALAYRFKPLVPQSLFRFFDNGGSLSSSATLTDIPQPSGGQGVVASDQFRVYAALGQGSADLFDPTASSPLTAVNWTNATDRTGLITQEWSGEPPLNDSTAMSVADVEHLFPPPFSVYLPHDAVTAFGGPASTGFSVYTAQYNLPFVCDNFTGGGPLVDYMTTSTVVTQGGTADITMPANVQAGDYLVLMQGNMNENVIDPSQLHAPAGWIHVWSQSSDYEWYKIADGTEGGTTVHFPLASFTSISTQRPWVAGVLQYRFTTPPSAIQSLGVNLGFSHSGGSATSSLYGPTYAGGGAYELRVYGFIGFGTSGGFSVPIYDSTWVNAVKRTPIINSEAALTGIGDFPDLMSFQMADEIDVQSTLKAQLTVNSQGDEIGGTGGDLFGIRFIFASPQCNPTVAYWGINASTPT